MEKLKFKEGVKLNNLHRREYIWRMLIVAVETAPETEDGYVWCTSANDGKHMRGSRHFTSQAFDIRTRNIKGAVSLHAQKWTERIKVQLGRKYDVLFEGDHIHIEYDPK